jgi:DNA-binding CsgD family transcriptional regulator
MRGHRLSERAARALPDLYALTTIARYPEVAMSVTRRLIGGDKADYTEVDFPSGDFKVLVDPEPPVLADLEEARREHMHEHPVPRRLLRAPDGGPWLISDFLTRPEFHRTPLYGEFFSAVEVEDQLTVSVSARAAISIDRDRRTFDANDRRELESVRPHLWLAYENAARFSRALRAGSPTGEVADRRIERLTDRQRGVLGEVAAGRTNAQVGLMLGISQGTVRKHLEHILRRLEVSTRTAAAVIYMTETRALPEEQWTAAEPGLLAALPGI